jgi:hypothetical protein
MTAQIHDDQHGRPPGALGSNEGLGPLPERWYCVSRDGLATLCADEQDARMLARHCDETYPKGAPYRAVLLGDVAAGIAEIERLRPALERLLSSGDVRDAADAGALRQARTALGLGPNVAIKPRRQASA